MRWLAIGLLNSYVAGRLPQRPASARFPACLYLGEFSGEQPLGGLRVEPERGQRLGAPAVGEQDAQQHVLCADVVVAEPQSRLQGAPQRCPAVRAEAQLVQDRRVRVRVRAWRGGSGPDRGADLVAGQPGLLDDPRGQAFRLGQQGRRQVRGTNRFWRRSAEVQKFLCNVIGQLPARAGREATLYMWIASYILV